MIQGLDMGKIAEIVGKVSASANFEVFKNTKIDSVDIYYKIVQGERSEINLKIKLQPADAEIENKMQELFKIILAFIEVDKIHFFKVA